MGRHTQVKLQYNGQSTLEAGVAVYTRARFVSSVWRERRPRRRTTHNPPSPSLAPPQSCPRAHAGAGVTPHGPTPRGPGRLRPQGLRRPLCRRPSPQLRCAPASLARLFALLLLRARGDGRRVLLFHGAARSARARCAASAGTQWLRVKACFAGTRWRRFGLRHKPILPRRRCLPASLRCALRLIFSVFLASHAHASCI